MGIQICGECPGCHREAVLYTGSALKFDESVNYFCARCRARPLGHPSPILYEGAEMPRSYFCNTCSDRGTIGFLNPDGWLAGELEGTWFDFLISQVCPKCLGNPQSLHTRPTIVPSPPPSRPLPQPTRIVTP